MKLSRFCFSLKLLTLILLAGLSFNVYSARSFPGKSTIEQIEFRDITVGDALRILAEQSNLNIIASNAASNIHVTMFLRHVTPMQVIDAIAKTYNLWYQKDDVSKIVRLYTVREYRLEQVEYRPEKMQIFTMKNAKNALDVADTIENLFGERVFLSFGENQDELRATALKST